MPWAGMICPFRAEAQVLGARGEVGFDRTWALTIDAKPRTSGVPSSRAALRVCEVFLLMETWVCKVVARILRATLRVCTTLRYPWRRVQAPCCRIDE
ncbi:MAG: hypothetical protein AUK47_28650 [Deltaproteobacteria bacterium CG2_30_63_29]|nr:MAG: hypothetical protein AUK47_28650 [Deltaproteobacteria bacterium CG2_30_63_29]PJB47620.1 MAG: hypothetical protein CO108_03765 [Deltaproteobacteria bacterium CG_4_9_14_3_um_filter_63_12]